MKTGGGSEDRGFDADFQPSRYFYSTDQRRFQAKSKIDSCVKSLLITGKRLCLSFWYPLFLERKTRHLTVLACALRQARASQF
jgi:hypothetical protein